MTNEKYNGWKNYETWLANLWLTNDQEVMEELQANANDMDLYDLAEGTKEWLTEQMNDIKDTIGNNLFSDLMSAAFSEIDFYEIAKALKED